jgi:hypothetical protein
MAESLVNIKSEKLLDILSLNAREVANVESSSSGTNYSKLLKKNAGCKADLSGLSFSFSNSDF